MQLLIALGVWQIERRAWKLALIERVEQRVHAPGRSRSPRPRHGRPSPPQTTNTGTSASPAASCMTARRWFRRSPRKVRGFWVLTPLQRGDGTLVLVNRGFVPSDAARRVDAPAAAIRTVQVEITGLLRMTEPKGGFLRTNDARSQPLVLAGCRTRSRRRAASTTSRPFSSMPTPRSQSGGGPIGGLTVISFPNNHLIYALTWFALAFMLAGRLFVTFGGGLFRRRSPGAASSTNRPAAPMPSPAGRDQMLERSSNPPDDGRTHGAVTLQSQADARSELIGAAPTDDETNRKNMALLIQLRWTAVVGQIVTIGGVHFWLRHSPALTRMGAVIGALIFLNVSSLVWVRHRAAITNNELLVALCWTSPR